MLWTGAAMGFTYNQRNGKLIEIAKCILFNFMLLKLFIKIKNFKLNCKNIFLNDLGMKDTHTCMMLMRTFIIVVVCFPIFLGNFLIINSFFFPFLLPWLACQSCT